jgi:hypothetical protein
MQISLLNLKRQYLEVKGRSYARRIRQRGIQQPGSAVGLSEIIQTDLELVLQRAVALGSSVCRRVSESATTTLLLQSGRLRPLQPARRYRQIPK